MRFLYYYPSYSAPSGGNKQLRLQGALLAELGHDVFLVRDQRYFDHPAKYQDEYLYGIELPLWPVPLQSALNQLGKSDVLILPEGNLDVVLPSCISAPCRIVINNQNGFYALRYFPADRQSCRRIDAVISNSPYNCTVSRVAYQIPASKVFYVPHWVLRGDFEIPAHSNQAKQLAICYMPRKLPELVGRVKESIQSRFPNIPWVEIDGVPESVVAQRLRNHTMFFAAQHLEGCPLTALEAMACRCLVAGFPGTEKFTHPYASESNGYWAEDSNLNSAIENVARMVQDCISDQAKVGEILQNGVETAQRYSKSTVTAALERLVEGLARSTSDRPSTGYFDRRSVPEEQWRWSDYFYAQRKKYHYGRLGGPLARIASAINGVIKPNQPK